MTSTALRPARRSASCSVLLAVALLAGCGSDGPEAEADATRITSRSAPSTSARSEAASAGAPSSFTVPSVAPPTVQAAEFDLGMVRSIEVNKENKGGQANVHVVAGLTGAGALLDVAEGCVEHYLDEQKAAFCHVWSTEANFAARDPEGVGDLLCWTHYVGVPLAGGDPVVTTSEPYMLETEGCPDASA